MPTRPPSVPSWARTMALVPGDRRPIGSIAFSAGRHGQSIEAWIRGRSRRRAQVISQRLVGDGPAAGASSQARAVSALNPRPSLPSGVGGATASPGWRWARRDDTPRRLRQAPPSGKPGRSPGNLPKGWPRARKGIVHRPETRELLTDEGGQNSRFRRPRQVVAPAPEGLFGPTVTGAGTVVGGILEPSATCPEQATGQCPVSVGSILVRRRRL